MTVSTTATTVSYAGDGVTTSFPVPFLFLANGDITAILRDSSGVETVWTENTQYTLSGAGVEAGGTLAVSTSPTDYTPASGETLVIKRTTALTQGTDYPEGGEFPASAHETALDRLTLIAQQIDARVDRALRVPDSDAATNLALPIDTDRASKFLSFDASGNVQASAVSPSGATSIVDSIQGFIEVPVDKTYTLDLRAPFGYTVTSAALKTASGSCTAALRIDGTDITGISAVAVSSTEQTATATGANAVAPGQTLDLVVSAGASPADLAFTIAISRAI